MEALSKHKEEMAVIRSIRLKEREKVNEDIRDTQSILDSFNGGYNSIITFDELSTFEIGQRISLNENIDIEKTFQNENRVVFITYMKNGGEFGAHSHDCIERVKIVRGHLIDRKRGYNTYSQSQELFYAAGEEHEPYATLDSVYIVTFYKTL